MIQGLSERLKELRIKNNYSQKDVATFLNLSPSIVSGYETGERTPSTDVIIKLASLYHCSTDFLLGIIQDDISIYIDVTGLTPEQIQSIHTIVDSMKKS